MESDISDDLALVFILSRSCRTAQMSTVIGAVSSAGCRGAYACDLRAVHGQQPRAVVWCLLSAAKLN
jgi:hypothetical protein